MHSATTLPAAAPAIPVRDQFAPIKVVFLVGIHLGAVTALWHSSWAAVVVCFLMHAACGGVGICIGYHRLLTHRSFKCPPVVEYGLALLGSLSIEGGPIEWVAHHRQHHQYPDQDGDPHNARQGFWWSHVLWMLWTPSKESQRELVRRYAPDLLRVPFYRFLSHAYVALSVLIGALLYLLGGWTFVVWGMFVRLVITYHTTWLVNSASHSFGYKNFPIDDLSTNCWWVALLSGGEGWHNNHHAFPTSARHGLKPWEIDVAYVFIRSLQAFGLAWDVQAPPVARVSSATSGAGKR
jgi:fatty-acid desaturase